MCCCDSVSVLQLVYHFVQITHGTFSKNSNSVDFCQLLIASFDAYIRRSEQMALV